MGDYTLQDAVRDLLEHIDGMWAENEEPTWEMLRDVRSKIATLPRLLESL